MATHAYPLGPVADRNAFPLHRSTWSFAQRWAYPTGIVAGSSLAIVGLLSVIGLVQRGRGQAAVGTAMLAIALAVGAHRLGRRLGRLSPRTGVLVIHPDRIVIGDDQLLGRTIELARDEVLDVAQPGVRGSGPLGAQRDDAFVARLVRGDASPNVEVWLRGFVEVPGGPPETGGRVTMLQLRTPGAAALLRWAQGDERFLGVSPKWYDRAEGGLARWY